MTYRTSIAVLSAVILLAVCAAPARADEQTVPDVVGLTLDQAQGLMDQAGFEVRIEHVMGQPLGRVVSQEPGGLCRRDTATPIRLKVGGPSPKPGMDAPPAQPDDDLPPAGSGRPPVEPGSDTPPADAPPAGAGTAFAYGGRAIPPGRLPSDNGPEVPNVIGQNLGQARGTLRGWKVNVEQTLGVETLIGKVVNQWPYAGMRVASGETITVVIAVANRPSNEHLYVPQAQSRGWRDGIERVEKAGFVPQPVSVASSESDRGRVVAQVPQPGSLAIQGRPVRLFIGRGPGAYSADVEMPSPTERPVRPTPAQPAQPTQPTPAPAQPDDDLPPAGSGSMPIEPGADEPTPTRPEEPGTPPSEPPPTEPTPAQPTPTRPEPEAPKPRVTLGAPSLRTPPAGESYPYKYGADFSWTAVRDATGYELELQEEQPSGAWRTVSTTPVTEDSHRPAKIERGRYRWRVRAVAEDGTKGKWSEYRRLYMY